ncbi:hypothetical protein [Flavobacterium sp. C3NV]|uniref:hypothetical protein n=1 Tax=Flavobacterium sp. C3NV TaxID=3393358 RepID=UPI0039900D93
MKEKLIIIIAFFVCHINFAQHIYKLGSFEINNDAVYNTGINSGNVAGINLGFDGANGFVKFGAHTGNGYRGDIFYMRGSDGNVGIGTTSPLAKLEINNGNILVRNSANVDNESSIMIAHSINAGNLDDFGTSIRTITQNAGNNTYGMQFFTKESYMTHQTEKLRILGNGNVGIGTIYPTNKLDVNGTIHSKEVKVDMNGWSDFVFKKEYNLPTLEQVEKHIAEKGHLQNIPSEEEVLQNGINLGEMNAKLLQKIEELTLYLLKQDKSIEDLKIEVNNLKKQYR